MASTSSLFSGLSGLSTNSRRLEVIGNNIANSNTTAYKSNRIQFTPSFNRNLSLGTVPNGNNGGTNPAQVGLGVQTSGTQRNNANGAINPTGVATDMAIEGNGWFIVEQAGTRFYSRDGSFQLNSENQLVNQQGARVQGYGVDQNFNIVEGELVDLSIPVGSLSIAEATTSVTLAGNLNIDGDVATRGTLIDSAGPTADLLTGGAPVTTTALTGLDGGRFAVGDTIELTGVQRGGKDIPDATFTVTATDTVDDLLGWMQSVLGIIEQDGFTAGDVGSASTAGVTLDALGNVEITGNYGELNDIDISTMQVNVTSTAAAAWSPVFTKQQAANGESVRTTMTVYDSVGTPHQLDVTMTLSYQDDTGHFARLYMHSDADTDIGSDLEIGDRTDPLGAGKGYTAITAYAPQIQFDEFGVISSDDIAQPIEIDLNLTGAVDPLNISLLLSNAGNEVSGLADSSGNSTITVRDQDGLPFGVLNEFSVGRDGVISGFFSNGQTRDIGQVMIATFTNDEGLVDTGSGMYREGPNSGTAQVTVPQQQGSGAVIGSSLELSNVDLSQEFINMILTSTGYNASSRVISTSDQLLQTLISLGG